ncbi:MAG: glycosyl hydrolase family 16 [Flavobacteriaceae bacterium]|nr:glycosyl hydrolase family 16 [Flavobacteriaceae bacterium]
MKIVNNIKVKFLGIIAAILVLVSCERDISDEAVFATFSNNPDIYTDNPVGLTDEFFVSFDPALGANTEAFGTDNNVAYEGTSSIRIDVPAPDDPNGSFVGGIFLDRGAGRNLTGYDALTFWARGSTTATVGLVGFGTDFEENKFAVAGPSIRLSTDWKKYIIPIPDPSKLIQERGMFVFSAGGLDVIDNIPNGNEIGFTFWMDEIRFENLGTVAQLRPAIFSGQDLAQQTFIGSTRVIGGLRATFNGPTGENITVGPAPSYFNFSSSNPSVAFVNELGEIQVIGEGTTTITAQLDDVLAEGSLELTSGGELPLSPTPTQAAEDVRSIYSDSYTSVTNSDFNPGFGGSTTQTTEASLNGNNVQIYANNNFTGILFDNTVDGSEMTHLHVDVYTQSPGTSVEIQIRDVGANGELETNVFNGFPDGDDKDFRFTADGLQVGQWTSFEIPLGGDIATQKNNLGALILVGGPDFILDNIYFYKE